MKQYGKPLFELTSIRLKKLTIKTQYGLDISVEFNELYHHL